MTKAQIEKIVVDYLDDKVNTLTRLSKCNYFTFSKMEHKFCGSDNMLFYFDTNLDIVECYPCKRINPNKVQGTVSATVITDNGVDYYYELLKDASGNTIYDSYTFDEIILFKLAV